MPAKKIETVQVFFNRLVPYTTVDGERSQGYPGDSAEVDVTEAKRLVDAGFASRERYAQRVSDPTRLAPENRSF